MVQERVSGNGNFENLDEIIRRANPVQFAQEQAINDIVELIEDFTANRSGGSGNELEAILGTNIAAKLPAGAITQITNAIFLEVERRDRTGFSASGNEQWENAKTEAKKERELRDKVADMADDVANASARMTPQQWDEAPSSEYPGMTNAEALAAIRRITGNLPFYSQLAVSRGLIKEEERPEFERLMLIKQRMMEAEREGRKPDPADVQAWKDAPSHLRKATADTIQFGDQWAVENTATAPLAGAQAVAIGANASLDARTDAFSVDDGVKPSVAGAPVSVAKSLDQAEGSATDQPSITTAFNASANGAVATPSPAAAPVAPAPLVRVASANFDQSAGMI